MWNFHQYLCKICLKPTNKIGIVGSYSNFPLNECRHLLKMYKYPDDIGLKKGLRMGLD